MSRDIKLIVLIYVVAVLVMLGDVVLISRAINQKVQFTPIGGNAPLDLQKAKASGGLEWSN